MTQSPPPLSPEQKEARLKRKNLALFAVLIGFVVLVFAITIIKMKIHGGAHP